MILGIGNDIVDVARIESALSEKFIARIFTPQEQSYCDAKAARANAYAKRFAAKEATAKALGVKIGADAFATDIEIYNDARGAPHLRLTGRALTRLEAMLPQHHQPKLFLALADEKAYAIANVIIEAITE